MRDLPRFRDTIQEYLQRFGLKQQQLATASGMSSSDLSRLLNGTGPRKITCVDVRSIVKGLADIGTIRTRNQARDLLDCMVCEYFSDADWEAPPLKDLEPDPPLTRQQTQISSFSRASFRAKYLVRILQKYSSITLPIGPSEYYSLKAIFQPLKLRKKSLAAEDLNTDDRRALLDEMTRGVLDPRLSLSEEANLQVTASKRPLPPAIVVNSGKEALEKSKEGRIIFLGPPGSGKTTMLQDLIVKVAKDAQADPSSMMPIYIPLIDLADKDQTLQGYLPILLGNLGMDVKYASILWEEIQQGHAFICLDGLDEITSNRQSAIIDWINRWASDKGNIWCIGTRFARFHSGRLMRGIFSEWEILPLSTKLRRDLAKQLIKEISKHYHRFGKSLPHFTSSFIKAIEKHPRAVAWGNNPLLLSLAAIVYVDTGSLPPSRAELYNKVIDAVLKIRPKVLEQQPVIRLVTSSLALKLYEQKRRIFTGEMLYHLLPEIRQSHAENWNTEEIANSIIDSGLIEVVAGYWHLSYQEYLASVELARRFTSPHQKTRSKTWNLAWEKRTYSRWTEVLRLLVGILAHEHQSEGAQRALQWLYALVKQHLSPQGDVGDLGLILAIYSLGEIGEATNLWKREEWVELEGEVATTWVQTVLEVAAGRQEARQKRLLGVAQEINQFDPIVAKVTIEQLKADFSHKNARTRKVVLTALGKLGEYAHLHRELLLQALGDKHSQVREAAAYALAELEEHAPIDALIRSLKDESTAIRVAATQALGEIRRTHISEHLLPGLDDEEYSVRVATIQALGKLGKLSPIEELTRMLSDTNILVKLAAIETLGLLGEKTYDRLKPLLEDPEDLIRAEVIKILGRRAPISALIREVTRPRIMGEYSHAYEAASSILGELEEQEIQNALSTIANTEGRDLWELIQWIRETKRESPKEEVVDALYNFGNHKRKCLLAAYILGRRNEWMPLEQFCVALESGKHVYTRAIAVRLLGRLGQDAPVDLILQALVDKDTALRLAAVRALEDLEDYTPPGAKLVAELLIDREREIRLSALRVLARVSEHIEVQWSLIENLVVFANAQDGQIQEAAKVCLEKLSERLPQPFLADLFGHEFPWLRLASIQALGSYASLDQLKTALLDRDPEVRAAAIHELGRRREQSTADLLVAALDDENVEVHRSAIQALERLGQNEVFEKRYEEDELFPLEIQVTIALGDFKEWRILARLCKVEELLTLNETGAIPLDNLEELYSRMQFYSGLSDSGGLIAGETRTTDDQRLTQPSSAIISDMYEQLHKRAFIMLKERVTVDQLLVASDHENESVRYIALHVLDERTPRERLVDACDDESSQVRREALRILGEDIPIDLLITLLKDESDFVRELAQDLLKQLSEHVSEAQLQDILKSSSGPVRASAIKVMVGRLSAQELKVALGDSSEEVHLAAADALRQAYPEVLRTLVPELIAACKGEALSTVLVSTAKSFIAEIIEFAEDASPFLTGKLTQYLDRSSYWEVRMRAAQALIKLHRHIPDAIEPLLKIRNDPESRSVQIAADDALAEILSLEPGVEEE